MSDYDCTRIVYSSSATVYGTPPDIPIPETTRLKGDSPYGRSKVMSETIIEDLCHGDSTKPINLYSTDQIKQPSSTAGVLSLFVTSSSLPLVCFAVFHF